MKSSPSADYAAVRSAGAGLIDLSARGRFLISGSEAVMFLNGLITNDMKTLARDSWMPAVFPNAQGRLIAAIRVIHRVDGFLIDTEAVTRDAVLKLVERFTLAGDFRVTDLTEDTALLSIQGPQAAQQVAALLGIKNLDRTSAVSGKWKDAPFTAIRATHTAEDGFDLFVPANNVKTFGDAFAAAGVIPVSSDSLETLRIEAGIARYGVDVDETNVVTETNLDDAVSFTKGCYIGQEIIARIKYRGHVAKKLTGLLLDLNTRIDTGAIIVSEDGKEIGRITSATYSPKLALSIALGYIKYDYLAPGTKVAAGGFPATTTGLPFVRGSWYPCENG